MCKTLWKKTVSFQDLMMAVDKTLESLPHCLDLKLLKWLSHLMYSKHKTKTVFQPTANFSVSALQEKPFSEALWIAPFCWKAMGEQVQIVALLVWGWMWSSDLISSLTYFSICRRYRLTSWLPTLYVLPVDAWYRDCFVRLNYSILHKRVPDFCAICSMQIIKMMMALHCINFKE